MTYLQANNKRQTTYSNNTSMNILVIGSGGREHALVWALAKSPLNPVIYVAPGNPGIAELASCIPISVNQLAEAIQFAKEKSIDLTIVGPEVPLVNGWVDAFGEEGLRIFGPTAKAAELEGSKVFAKDFMERHQIPTALHKSFTANQYVEAEEYIKKYNGPLVLKADGLAAGKGVLMCATQEEALDGLKALIINEKFGEAGASVVIEEWMQGEEVSVFVMTDGERYITLAPAQDHKRIGDGDTGLNTGGMGTYAPAPIATKAIMERVRTEITEPTLQGLREEGRPFQGFLYIGLMITNSGPKVVEYNCRFGDPEAQVCLPLLQDDLLSLISALVDGSEIPMESATIEGAAACVILASGGYPEAYEKGKGIQGIRDAQKIENVHVFHAGTKRENGTLVTSGGRVLGVTAVDADLRLALERAYNGVACIHFEGQQYRKDIGQKGLKYL